MGYSNDVFAKRLRMARAGAHVTQKELAEQVGINVASVVLYEGGKNTPSFETVYELAVALNVSPNYLCAYSEPVDPLIAT